MRRMKEPEQGKGLRDVEGIQGHIPVGGAKHHLGFLEVSLWPSQFILISVNSVFLTEVIKHTISGFKMSKEFFIGIEKINF